MKPMALVAAATGVISLACADNTPASPPNRTVSPRAAMAANIAGTEKTPISGTLQIVGLDPPTRTLVTPSDRCHLWNGVEHTVYSGDVQGSVTYIANVKGDCALTHFTVSGTFGGQVTFQGRSGEMAGIWETNCKFDPALGTPSCDGVSNARGSGGLEGVQFHIKWGPGWWPFPYSGTAFSQ